MFSGIRFIQQDKVDIKTGALFPWPFLFLALLALLGGLALLSVRPILAIPLLLVSVTVISAHAGLLIDKKRKVYREYYSFLLFKTGTWTDYTSVEKLFINRTKSSQQVHPAFTNHSSILSSVKFNAYIKFADGTKMHIVSSTKKDKTLDKASQVTTFLSTHVEDFTD